MREKAYEEYKAGLTPKEIAEKHGIKLNTVQQWRKRDRWVQRVQGTGQEMNLFTIYLADICTGVNGTRCSYCLAERFNKKTADTSHLIPAKMIFDYQLEHMPPETWMIEITGGGEPALHPEIDTLVEILSERGYYGVVRTNGAFQIPKTDTIRRVATWHYTHTTTPPYSDVMTILRNPADDWQGNSTQNSIFR
ncbi:MAG: helix-turn-helix domain-containing protein [Oscillospiraceae bacterium]|nr:helix-turn-helix domain-containing protein [Oscillospiraceae bacterium]